MNIIKTSIERPIAVISAVLMVVMFGLVALQTIPIQLTPDVNRPVITISTQWPGAAPVEIEREVTNRQEDVLKGIPGMQSVTSASRRGSARVTLEFDVGTNMDRALLLVANRLDRVSSYPEEADEPTLSLAGAEDQPIAWFIISRVEGNERPIHEYGMFLNDVVKERVERVPGISEVSIFGGSEREIQVIVRPEQLARYGMTISQMTNALRSANIAISAGKVDEGKRSYTVRTEGELTTVQAVRDVVLRTARDTATGRIGRVTVGDMAEVRFDYKEPGSKIRQLGEPAVAFNAKRETGANVIETMAGIREAVADLNNGPMPRERLTLTQVYDETVYIESAVELVRQNIYVGGTLAAFLLLLFLRSWRATLIVSIAIPVSVVGSFVAMAALGRSLNVISLAGLAFAVGMVVDAAIVVLENIFRLREQGRSPAQAAYEGASQVWGAVLVSALTTVMVFIPILVMQLQVGQLFRDIAVAISVSVMLSLLVSVTVLPALASRLLVNSKSTSDGSIKRLFIPGVDHFAGAFVALITGYAKLMIRSKFLSFVSVLLITAITGFGAWKYLPELEYLPNGNRNLVFGIIVPPPGYNLDTTTSIAESFEEGVRPLWASETGPESKPGEPPKIERFFFVATPTRTFIGAAAVDPQRAGELRKPLNNLMFREPGTFGVVNQTSIFGRGLGSSRQIDVDIAGPDLETILRTAGQAAGLIFGALPRNEGNSFRPLPGLELGAPEVRVTPNRTKLADAGVSARELGQSIDAFNDGLRVAEVTVGGDRLDLMLKGQEDQVTSTQGISSLPVVTGDGQILPVSSLADVDITAGPTELRHKERNRTVTLLVTPRDDLSLERALNIIQSNVIDPLEKQGLPQGVQLRLSGTADKLDQTWTAMR
ncbi:MAG: efflux RND transporter permease subunit, partial [Hyphomicrobiales bacterium]